MEKIKKSPAGRARRRSRFQSHKSRSATELCEPAAFLQHPQLRCAWMGSGEVRLQVGPGREGRGVASGPERLRLCAVGDSHRDRAASATEICLDWHVVNSESNLNSYLSAALRRPRTGSAGSPGSRTPADSGCLARAASGAAKRRRERPLTRIRAGI